MRAAGLKLHEHWPQSMSLLVAGGGMRRGQAVGSTNALGTHPHENPLTPDDLWATVYHHQSIDPHSKESGLCGVCSD